MMPIQTGRILHLQRLSTEDGPGIRTTVFFKGCPLRCAWCHNPESLSPEPQVQWLETRCIGCHTCLDACPNGCLAATVEGVRIDRGCCQGCGTCAEACPANALELLGTHVTVDELVAKVRRDRAYYETSGGGVTVSGGEPLLQPSFVAAFLAQLRAEGIATALDTCGLASRASLEQVLPHVDLVLFDLKEIDTDRHRAFTGQGNEPILAALRHVADHVARHAPGIRLWLRTPLIPGATATQENLGGLGAFIAANLDGLVERWELCAFNNLCRDKYRRLGMDWPYRDTPLLTMGELHRLEAWAGASGVEPEIVVATGATRDE
ncbi:MAG: glycyl-radical enzyme activating protein [Anaerolineae bacterium]|jgi:pyruvate formate lyase activating enzyme